MSCRDCIASLHCLSQLQKRFQRLPSPALQPPRPTSTAPLAASVQSLSPHRRARPPVLRQTVTHLFPRGQGLDQLLHCPCAVRVERRTDQPVLLCCSLEHLRSGQGQTLSDTLRGAGCNCVCHHTTPLDLRSKQGSHQWGTRRQSCFAVSQETCEQARCRVKVVSGLAWARQHHQPLCRGTKLCTMPLALTGWKYRTL